MKSIKQDKMLTVTFFVLTFISLIIFIFADNNSISTIGMILLLKSFIAGIVFFIQYIKNRRKSTAITNTDNNDKNTNDLKIHQQPNFIICMLIFIPVVGIILMWKYKKFNKVARIILTIIFSLATLFNIMLFSIASDTSDTPTPSTAVNQNDNLLMSAKINEAPVMNGIKTEKVGTYAYVKLTYDEFKSLTPEDFAEFATSKVENSGYNWFSIISDNGEGAQWPASYIGTMDIGTLDEEGCISKLESTWELSGNTYIEFEDDETEPTTESTTEATTTKKETTTKEHLSKYIANTSTGKFHSSSCYMVNKMEDSNKEEFECSYDDMIAKGYSPCKKCFG